LIFSGVAGFGLIVDAAPWVLDAIRWGGAAFLVFYAGQSLYSAYTSTNALTDSPAGAGSLRAAVMAALILTWANPHVYLDTFGLIGAVAAQYGPGRWWFGTGAFTASTVFFLTLGYGARGLAPIFRRPGAWRVLDGIVGFTMLGLAIKLVFLA
jgi:L-lysine exporter family protein LysE/ArgO